jgi:hypothetical protein
MQPHRLTLSAAALALAFAIPTVAAIADPAATFDGRYRGSMSLASAGLSNAYSTPACVDQRPAVMLVRGGYVFMSYRDWGRHRIHYRGTVNGDGTVNAYHRNGDGSSSVLTGRINGAQLTADMRRGLCAYTVALTRG